MIKIEDLSLKIKNKELLSHINIEAKDGQITGLIGYNGSGKTLIMKCVCGFITSYTGKIYIDEKDMRKRSVEEFNMGIQIETPSFISFYTGFKNLKSLASLKNRIDDEKIEETMELVGLEPRNKLCVSKYSLGMRQRLGIAQAIMEDPKILILDEPFNSLDYEVSQNIRKILLEEKKKGKTIIITSHNPYDIEALCDVTYKVEKGKITY
jgi:ABC-2 type transport system ATP-binding protein